MQIQLIDLIYFIVYSAMMYCSILWLTVFFKNRKRMLETKKPKRLPSITFLVPAHNEEKNIEKCLKSILNLNYPKNKLKVIVIDDGSTDKTAEKVKKFKRVKLIKQKHSGKAAALNHGLSYVKTELVACMDADSFPEKDFLLKMVGYLEEKNVASVTPALKVAETSSILQKIQWVEYLWQIFLRRLFYFFDCQFVIPGPGSIYKAKILKKIGGFDEEDLTEDTEIGFRVICKGYKISNSIDAYVYTDVPKNFKPLFKQRIRWYRGYLQDVFKYSKMIANPKYGNLGLFILPINFVWTFIYGFLFFSSILNFGLSFFEYFTNWSAINFNIIVPKMYVDILLFDFYTFFWFFFMIVCLLIIWLSVSFSGEKIDLKKKFTYYLSYILFYPILVSFFWVVATICELARVRRKW